MSLDNIIKKISDDSNVEAEEIIKSARDKASQIQKEGKTKAIQLKSELIENAKREANEEYKRILTLAGLEFRKKVLGEKRNAVDNVFEKTKHEIKNIDDKKYADLMQRLLIKHISFSNGVVFVSEKRKAVWENIINNLDKKYKLELDFVNNADFEGFILRAENTEIDCSIDALFKSSKDKIETKTAEILFKEMNA